MTANLGGSVFVLRSEPGGTFGAHADQAVNGWPNGLVVRDLDADGRMDIATSNFAGGSITVLRGQGGRFHQFFNQYLSGLAAGDLDGDSRLDLASSGGDKAMFALLLGRSGGNSRCLRCPLASARAATAPRSATSTATGGRTS